MIGTRPLTDEEVRLMTHTFNRKRDELLFVMGVKTGFRISELLSLTIKDILQHGELKSSITVYRRHMKGNRQSRVVPLNQDVLRLLQRYINEIDDKQKFLFESQKSGAPISRIQAWRIIKEAADHNKLKGKIATHSMRKTFARKVHHKLKRDVFKTQIALGHKNPSSTLSYLSFEQDEIDKAILDL